mmetsp:Transcript_41572/g.115844  ORF Transcript_41572/g.115844 Transcript_41572/m.115844 type:complete len:217 (-) Transcript_41572:318-968(-)
MLPWKTTLATLEALSSGSACLVTSACPMMLTAQVRAQSSAVASSMLRKTKRAALLTRMSQAPHFARVASTSALTLSSSAMSVLQLMATSSTLPSKPSMVPIFSSVLSQPPRLQQTTLQPSSTKRIAMASPKPREAPVMMATRPARRGSRLMRPTSLSSGAATADSAAMVIDSRRRGGSRGKGKWAPCAHGIGEETAPAPASGGAIVTMRARSSSLP